MQQQMTSFILYKHTHITFAAGTDIQMPTAEWTNPIWQKLMSVANLWDWSNDFPQCTVRWTEGELLCIIKTEEVLFGPLLPLSCQVVC